MIKIEPIEFDYCKGFIVSGHADHGEHGQDIVCASVSAIVQAVLLGLDKYSELRVTKHSGYVKAVTVGTPDLYRKCLIYTLTESLHQLAKQYPNHIQIEGMREDEEAKRI